MNWLGQFNIRSIDKYKYFWRCVVGKTLPFEVGLSDSINSEIYRDNKLLLTSGYFVIVFNYIFGGFKDGNIFKQ